MPGMANNVFVSRRRLSVSLADVRAAVAEAARQSVRDQLIQHAGKRLVLLEHKSEEAWGTPKKVTRRRSGRPHTCRGTLETTADGQTALGSPPASPPQHVEEIAASQRRPPAEEPCLQEEQALIWRVVFQHAHFDDDEDIEALCGALRLSLRNGVNIPQPGRGGPTVDIRLGSLLLETVACTL